jgi:tetratricopeptide (TPR) repeat protein
MASPENTYPTAPRASARLTRPVSLLGLTFACVLLAVIGGAIFAGYRAGEAQRVEQIRATQTVELQVQFDLGVTDLDAGRYAMAIARFEYILKIDPAYSGAAEKLAEARAALQITPAPTALPTLPASKDPAEIFARATQADAAQDWDGVIALLAQLHAVDPDYENVNADGMLFTALRNRGIARIEGDAMEAGMRDLDQARAFGPLDDQALSYRAWARLYLEAQSYWGLNWMEASRILQQLYVLAPNFKDTTSKYYEATLNYARQLDAAGDVCGAVEPYAVAQALSADEAVAQALQAAEAACALTPTPEATSDLAPSATPDAAGP